MATKTESPPQTKTTTSDASSSALTCDDLMRIVAEDRKRKSSDDRATKTTTTKTTRVLPDLLESAPLSAENSQFKETLAAKLSKDERESLSDVDWILFVRGYAKEENRLEKTAEVMRKVLKWRADVGYAAFAKKRLVDDEMFYQMYPETITGTDKYGHLIESTRIAKLNTDALTGDFEVEHLKRLQAQKLFLLSELKRLISESSGVRTYKHSVVIDLSGMSLSMIAGDGKRVLQEIMGIGNSYFPESLWKMYLVNAPFIFKAVWNVVSPFIHPITKAKIRIEKDPAKAKQCMLDDGVPLSSIPDYLGGDSAGVDAADLLLRGMVDVDADDPRQAWPKRERRELAPSIVKRRGFHGSVYSQDATPFSGMSGWLEKRGDDGYFLSGTWARKWFRTNNEYLNYFDDERCTDVLGSYNIKKIQTATVAASGTMEIRFKDGMLKTLRAEDDATAKQWIKELLDRKTWFDDIWDATESALKKRDMENATAAKRAEDKERRAREERRGMRRRREKGAAAGRRTTSLLLAVAAAVLAAVVAWVMMVGWW